MDDSRRLKQALYTDKWIPQSEIQDTLRSEGMDLTWEDVPKLSCHREEWHQVWSNVASTWDELRSKKVV